MIVINAYLMIKARLYKWKEIELNDVTLTNTDNQGVRQTLTESLTDMIGYDSKKYILTYTNGAF